MAAPTNPPTTIIPTTNRSLHKRLISALDWRLLVVAAALLALFILLFTFVQLGTTALVGTDGYYHARMGWLIRHQGFKPPFVWLPNTILNEEAYYDHHLLYHLYLALFAGMDPTLDGGTSLTNGAKIASILMPSLAFLAIWWLIRGQGVRWAAVWTLGLFAVSEAFLYRMSMPRAQAASLLIMVLGLHFMFKERYWLLLPLGFAYVWLYNAFPLLLMVGALYFLATLLTERRLAWQAILFPTAGMILGILVNPYFPQNIIFIVNHLLPKIGESSAQVGNEWYPYQTSTLVENSGLALLAMVLGAFAWGWRKERMDRFALTAFFLAVVFAFMVFRSRRFIEYFPAFALIFAVVSFAPLVEEWLSDGKPRRRIIGLGLIALLVFSVAGTLTQPHEAVSDSKPADQYAAAAIWLSNNSPPESMVFQTDWDDFTRLFFYDLNNIYTVGLDPTYMQLFDAALYDEWREITRGEVEDPGEIIRDRFGAAFVFSDLVHDEFLDVAAEDPSLQEIYRDDYAVIFALGD